MESFGLEQRRSDGVKPVLPSPSAFTSYFVGLHYLELRLSEEFGSERQDVEDLLSLRLPRLRTLILDGFGDPQPQAAEDFWKNHSGIQKVLLGPSIAGNWFLSSNGNMLPNLCVLGVCINYIELLSQI